MLLLVLASVTAPQSLLVRDGAAADISSSWPPFIPHGSWPCGVFCEATSLLKRVIVQMVRGAYARRQIAQRRGQAQKPLWETRANLAKSMADKCVRCEESIVGPTRSPSGLYIIRPGARRCSVLRRPHLFARGFLVYDWPVPFHSGSCAHHLLLLLLLLPFIAIHCPIWPP